MVERRSTSRYTVDPEDSAIRANPFKILQLTSGASQSQLKAAFRSKISNSDRDMRKRATLACEYCYDRNKIFKPNFYYALIGNVRLLKQCRQFLDDVDENDELGRTVLYLAARSGYFDVCQLALKMGASVNELHKCGSTPLHAAAFYGHQTIVELLIQYGVDTKVQNKWNGTALEEAKTTDIGQLITTGMNDKIDSLASKLISNGLATNVKLITHGQNIIGVRIIRNLQNLDSTSIALVTSSQFETEWDPAWHGTKYAYLESIMQDGLACSGEKTVDGKLVKPPSGHYKLDETHFGIKNWAKAIFLSPSIFYAADECYAQKITAHKDSWRILIQAKVKQGSFKTYDPTTYNYEPIDGEPSQPEYRVEVKDNRTLDLIMRLESKRNVIVIGIVFVLNDFLLNATNYVDGNLLSDWSTSSKIFTNE